MEQLSVQEKIHSLSVEHELIQKQIAGLRKFWHEVNELGRGPKFEEMTARLESLREMLIDHFSEEERDGYLSSALRVAPKFRDQAQVLQAEHHRFVHDLDALVERLKQCDCASWHALRDNLDDFMSRVQVHEAAETAILRHALGSSAD